MAIKEEFTWKEMKKIHDQAVEVLDREYNTIYIDDIIEGKLEVRMIFKTQESIKNGSYCGRS